MMRTVLRWLITVAVPVLLVMTVARLLTLPWYPAWEYAKPGFPADPLDMSRTERLRLAREAIDFLNMPRGLVRLGESQFADGTVAFNAREVGHMDDVKLVYDRLTAGALIVLAIVLAATWGLVRSGHGPAVWGAVSDGSLFTLCVLIALGAWMLVGFDAFFTAFHGVFFEGGTWLFAYTDTLIRLFPIQFWSDAGTLIAVTVGITAFALALLGRAMQKRGERANSNE